MKKVRPEDVKRPKPKPPYRPPLESWEEAILRILAEQIAVPMDLVAAFMKLDRKAAEAAVRALVAKKLVNVKQYFVNDEPWVWLTSAGMKQSGTGFVSQQLKTSLLPHYRGICEVRLDLEASYPDGEWVCERQMWRRLREHHHVPDAVFKVPNADGQVKLWAIEVERTQKTAARYAEVVAHRCAHYHRVFYYCTPQISRKFNQIPEFKHSKVLVTVFFKEHHEVTNFQWKLLAVPDLSWESPLDKPAEPWQADVLRLLSEQEAMPMDQFARFLKRDSRSAKAVAEHLREAGLIEEGIGPVDEGSWVWPTKHGARLCETGLKAVVPSLLTLVLLRQRNEARLFVEGLYPEGRWVSRRMLLKGNKGATVPAGVMEEGGKKHAVEIEVATTAPRTIAKKYEVRYEQYTRQGYEVLILCAPGKAGVFEKLKAARGWDRLTVKSCEALDPNPKPPQKKAPVRRSWPQSTVPLVEIDPADLPAELLREIEGLEGSPPKVILAGKRKGKGFPRWRITTEREVWRVTENPFRWKVSRASKEERAEKLLPRQKPKKPQKPQAPEGSLPMREIPVSELPRRVLEEIQAKEGRPPRVKQAAKRLGGGHFRWRVTTDREIWRITSSPWGWHIKRSGPIERVQPLLPPERPQDEATEMIEIGIPEVPSGAVEAVQRAAGSPFPPRVFAARKRCGGGPLRLLIETDMGTWRLVAVASRWKARRVT